MEAVDVAFAGIARQAELVRTGEISSRELTVVLLERIVRLDPVLSAFTSLMAERALAEADARDAEVAAGGRGPLLGVPVAIKDEFDVRDYVTSYGGASQLSPASADAEVVRRLRAAGAVILGKTAMPEFGQWPFTESVAHGYTRNPWDLARTPGGSSGGTAVAVAAGLVGAGLGGDGGGSVRIPAAYCGLFGLKAQRGRVSSAPHEDLWEALGTAGTITRSVLDSALLLDVISGSLPLDRWQAAEPRTAFVAAATTAPGRLRIAVSRRPAIRGMRLDPEQAGALERIATALRGLGYDVSDVDPDYPDATFAFATQFYAGVRAQAARVERPDLLERRTKQTVAIARLLPSAAVKRALASGERIAARVNKIFEQHDLLLTPTITKLPRDVGALDGLGTLDASLRSLPMIAYTAIWNVCGNPAASVPAGFSEDGMPLAVQLIARPHDEPTILQVAAQLEQAQPWAQRRPPVS